MVSGIAGVVDCLYEVPDVLWERIVPLLPQPKKRKRRRLAVQGWTEERKAMSTIFYILRTGCQCNALPLSLRASTTVFDRFQEWQQAGVFRPMWVEGLLEYDIKKGPIDWQWQTIMDGVFL
ncbi:MAG TPA: transposase [Nitrososphaera sp.]|nr:transposase [Nitrososphaera sp.]